MKERVLTLSGMLFVALLFSVVVLLAGRGALAQGSGPAVDWWVVAGGGGAASGAGGRVALHGTLGQPLVGPSSDAGGRIALSAGYWAGAVAQYRVYLPLALRR